VPLILLVDDDLTMLELLAAVLAEEGYQTQRATNGRQAWERLADQRPDLVLADVMMPFLNGAELAHAMAADPLYQGIPIILLTAGSAVRLETVPAAAILPKPVRLEQLLRTVASVLAPAGDG
jgi:CheY-like chemotaxis protein